MCSCNGAINISETSCRMTEHLVNNQFESIPTYAIVAWRIRYHSIIPWGNWDKLWNTSIRVFCVPAEFRARCLRNTSLERYRHTKLLTMVDMKTTVFWNVMPCSFVGSYQRFVRSCLHLQEKKSKRCGTRKTYAIQELEEKSGAANKPMADSGS